MFIKNVPNVFISDPSMLEIGMELWITGQGGMYKPQKPQYLGTVAVLDHILNSENKFVPDAGFFIIQKETRQTESSYRDKHILPQEYNNWYVCKSEEDAQTIYEFIQNEWTREPAYEADRARFNQLVKRMQGF